MAFRINTLRQLLHDTLKVQLIENTVNAEVVKRGGEIEGLVVLIYLRDKLALFFTCVIFTQ